MSIFTNLFGDPNEKYLKSLRPQVEKINALELKMQGLSDAELKDKTKEFRDRLQKGESLDGLLPEAFAVVREASRRQLGQRHFDVQLLGGMVLHHGKIAEMRTGEGKTLTATLAAYLNALEGKGVHVVTVNEYLARRDMVWMGQIYAALGMSVGCITSASGCVYDAAYINPTEDKERDATGSFHIVEDFLRPASKKEAYAADITYGTNHEFGFDYLRDNMVYDAAQEAQRGFHFCIVDEVDSILIDEARVPLIISGQAEDATDKYRQFAKMVAGLQKGEAPKEGPETGDFTVDEKMKAVRFTEQGQQKMVKHLGFDPWAQNDITTTHQLESALKAKALFFKDRDYVVKNGEVVIIDEFTGRMLSGRRWSQGLHQAVEAKEGVKVQPESLTLATITFQNFFRLYRKISGMTGTALTSAEEFDKVYKLDVAVVPTNRSAQRKDLPDKIFKTEEGKFNAVVREIKELHEKGQPVLVGTRSVEKNEFLGKLLDVSGVPHQILNAKNHEREGEIIAQAGKPGAVTIATNMAGRGVDIILGGNPPDPENAQKVKESGGLYVLGTERHDARRIDNQLRGRAGRQGDPGVSQFFVSLDDDLMRIFGGDRIKGMMDMLKVADDEPIQSKMVSGVLESAQAKVEGFNFDARHHLLEYDDVMNKHREIVYKKRKAFLQNPIAEIQALVQMQNPDYMNQLKEKEARLGEAQFAQLAKMVGLKVIDTLWQDHLTLMEHMRESVKLRAYGGKDPLVEYKAEGRRIFSGLLEEMNATIADNLLKAEFTAAQGETPKPKAETVKAEIQRNDPCPCGSGKKWKKCHMGKEQELAEILRKKDQQ